MKENALSRLHLVQGSLHPLISLNCLNRDSLARYTMNGAVWSLVSDDSIAIDSKVNIEIQKYDLIYRLCLRMLSRQCSPCEYRETKDHTALQRSLSTTSIMARSLRIEIRMPKQRKIKVPIMAVLLESISVPHPVCSN